MSENKMFARTIPLHDTEANWDKATSFIPMLSEKVVYLPDESHPYCRVKFGDGKTLLKDLEFNSTAELNHLFNGKDDILYFDGGKITDYYTEEDTDG